MRDELTDLARELVAIDSVNPGLAPGAAGEEEISRFVAAWLERRGLEVFRDEIAPGRWNVTAFAHGSGGGRSLLLNGHLDTVGYGGMERALEPARRRQPAVRARRLRHEDERGRGDAGRRASGRAGAARRRDRFRGRRRGGREHRLAGGRHGAAPGCGDRDRADRGARCDRAQGLRLARGRDAGRRGARIPGGSRRRRDREDGDDARRHGGARPLPARLADASPARERLAARVARRGRCRAVHVSRPVPRPGRAAHDPGRDACDRRGADPRDRGGRRRSRISTPTSA